MYHGIERRRFFRITDTLRIGYTQLPPASVEDEEMQISKKEGAYDLVSNFDNRIQTLVDAVRAQHPAIAELTALVNKKINFVIAHLELDPRIVSNITHTLRRVSLSACGVAFANDEPLSVGQKVKMDLVLQPSDLHICVIARVVACEDLPDAPDRKGNEKYYLRFNFDRIHPDDQELLIQHTVKRQSSILKARRETEEESKANGKAGETKGEEGLPGSAPTPNQGNSQGYTVR